MIDKQLVVLMTPGSASPFFKAVSSLFVSCRHIYVPGISWRNYPETTAVAQRVYDTHISSSRSGRVKWIPAWLKKLQIALQYNALRHFFESAPDKLALCWNGLDRKRLMFALAAKHANVPVLYSELAPFKGFLQIDHQGINAASSLPQNIEPYLQWAKATQASAGWDEPLRSIVARAAKKNLSDRHPQHPLPEGPFLLVPLQVQNDSQLRYFGDWIPNVQTLLSVIDEAALRLPLGWHIRIKEHPSSSVSFADDIQNLKSGRCYLSNHEDTFEQVRASQGVVTVNSSVGLQSFAYEKPVCVLGHAFYGFAPLVNLAPDQASLDRIFFNPAVLQFNQAARMDFLRYLLTEAYAEYKPQGKDNISDLSRKIHSIVDQISRCDY